ncbi:hypothetical protein [Beijerinckia sp. L45]|uniref:hypothetical protein n=1 Tax=Beijerinckia sp. L45 TaxID=1641855 RepID=UPI00131C45C6|nr:hypothetical protein [Beijerinckia sp. L45]
MLLDRSLATSALRAIDFSGAIGFYGAIKFFGAIDSEARTGWLLNHYASMKKPDDLLRQLFAIADMRTPEASDATVGQTFDQPSMPPSTPVSLMITNRQRAQLRDLGFSDDAIAEMRPAEAHRHLGL